MPVQPLLTPRGLFTNANALSSVPPGALLRADNLEIGRDGVLDSIRGLEAHAVLYDATFPAVDPHWQFYSGTDLIRRLLFWRSTLLAHRGAGKLSKATRASITSSGTFWWEDYAGTFNPPDASGVGQTMRFAQAGGSLFFTTSKGIFKLDGLAGTPSSAGVPKAYDPTAIVSSPGTAIPNNNAAAYRLVWCVRDSTGRLLQGAPSGRVVLSNASGTAANGLISTIVPPGITAAHFLQIYRSASVATGVEPSDEMQLVFETTGGHTVGATIQYTEGTPDALRGAAGYFSPSQRGLLKSNEPPPLARDIIRWRNNLFFLNTTTKRRRILTLIGTGTGSLSVADVLTFAGSTYTGIASGGTPNATNGEFRVYTAGTVAQNLEQTARDLIRAINARSGNTRLSAFYGSSVNDAPGKILLEEKTIGDTLDTNFALTVSAHGSSWSPELPTSGTAMFVATERGNGRIYWSKDGEYEAVPIGNNKDVGDGGVDGLRVLALRDCLIILKDDGAYRCTGTGEASFSFEELDTTALLLAPESAVVLSNQVFGLFDQGVCSLSDGSGLQVLSRPVEDGVLPLEVLFPTLLPLAFGIANEQARTYELHLPATGVATGMGRAYRYNLFTRAWTGVTRACTAGIVGGKPSRLFYGYANGWTLREKKTFTANDYQGSSFPFEVDSAAGSSITVLDSSDGGGALYDMTKFAVGQYVVQGNLKSRITGIAGYVLTVADPGLAWAVGVAESVTLPDEEVCRFAPATMGDPSSLKQIQDVQLFFEGLQPTAMDATYTTPFVAELVEPVDVTNQTTPGVAAASPPAEAVSGPWLTFGFKHRVLHEKLSCLGLTVRGRPFSEKGGR